MSMNVYYVPVGEMKANCYFLINQETKETVIVDPGDEAGRIIRIIREKELKPVSVLLTHGHFDHIMAAAPVSREFDIDVLAGNEELEVLANPSLNLSGYFGEPMGLDEVKGFDGGDVLELAGLRIKVIATPGHTKGSVCFYIEDESVLISGDTLFCGSYGRVDFPTGSPKALGVSIRDILFRLPEDTVVYSGHGQETTIGEEILHNPIGCRP